MSTQTENPSFLSIDQPENSAQEYDYCELVDPALLEAPADLARGYIAYNPSGIWTVEDRRGEHHNIMYVRQEPDRSNEISSHLGKSRVTPYLIDLSDPKTALRPYYDAEEKMGEDPALTRITRRLSNGAIQSAWLLSCVDAQPFADRPDHVESLVTRFYAGTNLDKMEHIADGPPWMKDIRVVQEPSGKIHIYGRPQPEAFSGNITHTTIPDISALDAETIARAPFIDESLLPIGSGTWGGVNEAFMVGHDKVVLAAHRAYRTGSDGNGRHYEAVLYGHNIRAGTIVELGILATANLFPAGAVKADEAVDLHDVVFPGGGLNGTLKMMTFGVRDASIGIGYIDKLAKSRLPTQ